MTADYDPSLQTLGDIDDRCALTGEDPVEVLRSLLRADDLRELVGQDVVGVVA